MSNGGCFGSCFGGGGKTQPEKPPTPPVETPVENTHEEVTPPPETPKSMVKAYWVRSADALKIGANMMRQQGITDLFIIVNRFGGEYDYNTFIPKLIAKFEGNPRVHAWVKCFRDKGDNWVDPADLKFQNTLLDIMEKIVDIPGLNGVHLDYIRYSGVESKNRAAHQQTPHGKETIADFVMKVYNHTKSTKPSLKLSAALMPEGAGNADSYGQDYKELAEYLDWLCPMIYKGNYKKDTAWIGKTTDYINKKAPDKVLSGLQTYRSDEDPTPIPEAELTGDINAALDNGAVGFVLFRYGLANYSGVPKTP